MSGFDTKDNNYQSFIGIQHSYLTFCGRKEITRSTLSGEFFFHLLHHILFNHDLRKMYHVHKGFGAGNAMTNDNRFGYTQYRGATIVFKIETFKVFVFYFFLPADLIQGFSQF